MNTKQFEDEDPMELVGMVMPGAPGQLEAMAEAIVDEYARMGWGESRLMSLFTTPFFMATSRIYELKGEAYVRDLILTTCARWVIGPQPAEKE